MTQHNLKPIKLFVVAQYFYPEQFRINDMCAEWVNRGYDVTVVTGIPNYPQGKFYKGYGWFKKMRETHEGVKIIRLPIISRGNSKMRLGLNYFSFIVSGFIWQLFTRQKTDCVFVHEVSPMTQTLVGVWYAKRRGIPIIHYVTDLWPDNFEALSGIQSVQLLRIIGKMVDYIYSNNNMILTSSRSYIDSIEKRGVPADKIEFWPHYAEDFYEMQSRNENQQASSMIPNKNGVINIAFTGNIGEAQGLSILPETAKLLRKKYIKACFYMIGEGRAKDSLVSLIEKENVEDYFRFIPRQPAEFIPSLLAQCDVGLVILSENPIFKMTIPTKLQSYMACGIPILASGDGEMCDIVKHARVGFCAQTGNPAELADCIERFATLDAAQTRQMKANALQYYQKHFNKEKLMNRMDEIILETIMEDKNI